MLKCLSSSIIHSLEYLPHNAVVINGQGVIQFTNRKWKAFSHEYGLSPNKQWIGAYYSDLMQDVIIDSDQWAKLYDSVKIILRREYQIYTSEFSIQTTNKGSRIFRLEIYPLLSDDYLNNAFIISLYDLGAFKEGPQLSGPTSICSTCQSTQALIPICASCKSIRNSKDEWITIEHFLKHQLSLQFTHDICPDCVRQLYPQYARAFKN
ncbi:hypothetical protein QNH28_05895 [Paenibacillus sp. G2S3]|uniref:hypothetical protein n=1 Tax=Paenibacillus sp. G2S3 TaxID=3047872 RepID=UPI0024C13CCC|nr:hypothetical protein [Paenibacillus sp. G2S3]WHY20525.1 hypothetical protein QNH28_05895 [Paenibacillus sp. G2S3]